MTNALPHDDQPTTYTGAHNTVKVKHIALERTPGAAITAHICLPDNGGGTYCGRFNPLHVYNLEGLTYPLGAVPHVKITSVGTTLPHLLAGMKRWQLHGEHLTACANCVGMLACEAEMIGHNAYRVKGTLSALEKLPPISGFRPVR